MDIQLQGIRVGSLVFLLFFASLYTKLFSQEYKHEIGGAGGISSYMGDANKTRSFLYPGAAGGGLFRYNLDLQWAIKATLLGGSISGNTADTGNRFPGGQQESFQRTLVDVSSQVEFHFFRFGRERGYLQARPYTPYLLTGVGVTFSRGREPFFGANIPFGIGFKYKLKNRMNIGAEFSTRKLFRDNLDVVEHSRAWSLDAPFGIESSPLKNQDWYSFAMIYLTWDFGLRQDPCR